MGNWHEHCYRKVFFDYHTQQNAPEVGRNFDADKWAASLADAGVQAVSCISKCGYGWRYYRKGGTGRVHPHLPEGMDILGETVRACHARGIRVVSYVHTFGSEYLAETKPEWRVRKKDGSFEGISICLLGPACDEEFLPQLKDIAGNYAIDGVFLDGTYHYTGAVCYCDACRARFRRDTGLELPESADDASAETYLKWVEKAYIDIRKKACDAVHSVNPDALVSVNWAYTTRQPEQVPSEIGFMTQDISQSNMAFTISLQARNWALTGKSFDVMNHLALRWWQEWSIKPVYSLKQECALLLSNGGKTWMGYQMYPQFGVEKALLGAIGETFDFVKKMEPIVEDAEIVPHVGVLHGASQIHDRPVAPMSIFADERSLMGLHRMFTFSGIHYDSVWEDDFLRYLPSFRLAVISGDQYVSPRVMDALEKYVKDGGRLLVTGKSGMTDADGRFVEDSPMAKLAGVSVCDEYPYSHGYIVSDDPALFAGVPDMPILSTRPFTLAKPTTARQLAHMRQIYLRADGKPLFTQFTGNDSFSPAGNETGTAAITLNQYGKGLVAYIASDVFSAYFGDSQWCLKKIVKHLVNDVLLAGRAVTLEAPDYVELAMTRKGGVTVVHLTNLVRESPATDFSGSVENIIGEEPLPIHNIVLTYPMTRAPKSVRIADADAAPDWWYAGGALRVRVKKLTVYACVLIEE